MTKRDKTLKPRKCVIFVFLKKCVTELFLCDKTKLIIIELAGKDKAGKDKAVKSAFVDEPTATLS